MERDDNKRQLSSEDGKAQPQAGAPSDRLRPWRRIGGQLVPLIGESGLCALFGRAVRTLAVRYEWMSVHATRTSIDELLAALERDMNGAEPGVADIANTELLNTFTRQLSTLIGEALTSRLLAQATASDSEGPKDAQEHK